MVTSKAISRAKSNDHQRTDSMSARVSPSTPPASVIPCARYEWPQEGSWPRREFGVAWLHHDIVRGNGTSTQARSNGGNTDDRRRADSRARPQPKRRRTAPVTRVGPAGDYETDIDGIANGVTAAVGER